MMGNDDIRITINSTQLATLIKSNISCHTNKALTPELIDELVTQIIDSVDYFLNKKDKDN